MAKFMSFSASTSKLSLFSSHLQLRLSPKATISATMVHQQAYWSSISTDLAAELERALPLANPLIVYEPMRHSVFASPKTMSPALCVAACELVGGRRNQAMPAACALHIMYAASIAHGDMPALLDHPAPSTHATFSENQALMSSDALVPSGYEWLANSVTDDVEAGRVLRVIVEMARATGSQGLVDGQYMLVRCVRGADGPCPPGWIERVLEKRDGEIYACGAACGAILGGGSEEEIERLRSYGRLVGMVCGMLGGRHWVDGEGLDVEELRSKALMELDGFEQGKVAAISSLVDYFGLEMEGTLISKH